MRTGAVVVVDAGTVALDQSQSWKIYNHEKAVDVVNAME